MRIFVTAFFSSVFALVGAAASAQAAPSGAGGAASPYASLIAGAHADRGLFTVWRKGDKIYLELGAAQLDRDFVETIVPSTGLGGDGLVWGNTDHLPTQIVRFERSGDQVAIVWPSPAFIAPHSAAASLALAGSIPRTIAGLATVAATDERTGNVVIDASPFLADQLNLKAVIAQSTREPGGANPGAYELEPSRTYFGTAKAFPKNVVIEATQSWTSDAQRLHDVPPDPRHVQMRVTYNIAEPPGDADYRPRYADDRIGLYDAVYQNFDIDETLTRKQRYIVRWNLQPSDSTARLSSAKHPMVFVMSDSIPEKYRPAIARAVTMWNRAFERIGMRDALQVVPQPHDANFDIDDIRYNVLRWVTEERASFGADSQTLYDPRTGQEFRTGVLISADVPLNAEREWKYFVDPIRFGRTTDPMPQKFMDDVWLSVIMHETGHNLGMQHNFIGSLAYTAAQLRDPAFTAQNGIASTVMEYAPINVWPGSMAQGDYEQTTLGPYDYFLMRWAYAPIPGAATPEAELPTLSRWASAWSDPKYRYASDEDVSWADGHAADPRSEQGDLTNDPVGWCTTQLQMDRDLMRRLDALFPASGDAYESETDAFKFVFGNYGRCATMPAHFIGGQYLSRAHRGDPGAQAPIVPVPRAEQHRAFALLDRYLFAADAWRLPPRLLSHLGYSEWAGYGYVNFEGYGNLPQWAYDPPQRHDYSLAEHVGKMQQTVLDEIFSAPVLARLVDGPRETSDAQAMTLADLFGWMHAGIFSDLRGGRPIDPLRRALQHRYVQTLVKLMRSPAKGVPEDAQVLARAELKALATQSASASRGAGRDETTRAHIDWIRSTANAGLTTSAAAASNDGPM